MPAYFDTGFSVREPMWHGEGLVLDEYPTSWLDAREKSGLTWEPQERPAFTLRPTSAFRSCLTCDAGLGGQHDEQCAFDGKVEIEHCTPLDSVVTPQGVFVRLLDHKLIVRSDNDYVLGVTSDEFSAIYHGDEYADSVGGASMEEIVEAFRGADGSLRFETAGSCRDGRQVWVLLYLDEPYTIPGDESQHLPFAALLNNHDGSGACKLVKTQVRVVCWNTFQMASASGDRSGLQFSFRHVGDVKTRIEDAKAAIMGLREESQQYVELASEMMKLNVNDAAVDAFLSEFLPSPRENGEQCTDRVHENVDRARQMFKHLYLDSLTTEGVRGTAWGLVQTSTEYLDHARAYRNPDTYLGRSILRVEPAKARALELARRVAS